MRRINPVFSASLIRAIMAACAMAAVVTRGADVEVPEVMAVGMVAPEIILLKIRAQRVEHGRQVPYEKQPGDKLIVSQGIHRMLWRGGKLLGALAGADGRILFTCDELHGMPLDVQWATRPDSFLVRSPDDARFSHGIAPKVIHRKSRPFDYCRTAEAHDAPQDHFLYLRLPVALAANKRYTIEFRNSRLAQSSVDFVYDSNALSSDAVHVSQIGFRPDDPVKVAFLSCWMGDGGGLSYRDGLAFSLIDTENGQAVFEGRTRLIKRATEGESGGDVNFQKADVFELDFSPWSIPGSYRISVADVGCSLPFPIAEDAWTKAFHVSVRGLYHQRSGISLGPPYTEYRRPRAFHPDDGMKVYHTSYSPGQSVDGGGFRAIVAGKTDEIVPNAWGGYMDAGDWDRRPLHTNVPRLLLDLYEMAPAKFDALNLNLPESQDELADLLNEALWFVDFHQRTQTPEGGIRPGIESAEHPRRGEASWQESLTVMAYAPNADMSYKYASVAAHAAFLLGAKGPILTKAYRESALRAFAWAEQQSIGTDRPNRDDERVLAAAELFRLTGDVRWHKIFLSGTRFARSGGSTYGGVRPRSGVYDPQDEAGWTYLRTERPTRNRTVIDNFRRALLDQADARIADISATGFRWVATKGKAIGYSTSVIPDAVSLVRAHYLTRDTKYLKAVLLACQHGAGANPLNLCYTTGVGVDSQRRMVHEDSYVSHQPLPPGLTVNGPYDPRNTVPAGHVGTVKSFRRFVYPAAETWPALESYFDLGVFSPMSEYTVHRNIAPNAYVWGYLALAR